MGRTATAKSTRHHSPARKDTLGRQLARLVDRGELQAVLNDSADARAMRLAEMMLDPAYRNFSFAKMCERVGMKSGDVLQLVLRYHLTEAVFVAARRLPELMEDILGDAMSSTGVCPRCDGKGAPDCPKCGGTGRIKTKGDTASRRLLLEFVGLIPRRPRARRRL